MKKAVNILIIALLFGICVLPALGLILPEEAEEELVENRNLARWPTEGSLKERIEGIEAYLNDHAAFRGKIIRVLLDANLSLGVSPDKSVILGKDGWLFYEDGGAAERVRGGLKRTDENYERMASEHRRNAEQLGEAGIGYYLLIAPDKHSIYPQFLPMNIRPGTGPSLLDGFYEYMARETAVKTVDVRPALIRASAEEQVYWKYDTHWNYFGAYAAYTELAERIRADYPGFHTLTGGEIIRGEPGLFSGDLAGMIGKGGILEEPYRAVLCREPHSVMIPDDDSEAALAWINEALPEAPKVVLIGDSFSPFLDDFLKESCAEYRRLDSGYMDAEEIEALGADIVILERVERETVW